MAEFLSKEEIKQWRSSLEKITLEEFAERLGKIVADAKPTNDLVDIVMNTENDAASAKISKTARTEHLSSIAERAFARERQLSHTPFSFKAPVSDATASEIVQPIINTTVKSNDIVEKIRDRQEKTKEETTLREEVDIVLKKNLTDREQLVFDYFLSHRYETVYAKDLAVLLGLPRDYIYKYIKNLRAKIEGDKLQNADRGGFILTE